MTSAGTPATNDPSGIFIPSVTTELAAIKHLTISRWYYTIRGREFSPWGSVIIWGVIEGERADDFRNMGDRVLWWGFVKGMERGARGSNVYRVLKGFEIKLKGLVENE